MKPVDTCNLGPDICVVCRSEFELKEESRLRRKSYPINPQRRLRRLKRLLVRCGGIPTFEAPRILETDHDYRLDLAEQLLGLELEWACKTAMESIGGEW